MRVTIVSHSYLEPEHHKNLGELAALVDVQWVTPERAIGLVRRDVSFSPRHLKGGRSKPLRAIRPFGAQYVLLSPDFGLRRFRPDVIHVEYEPWSLIFWQAALYQRLWAPQARLVSTVKKNTYRAYPGLTGMIKRKLALAGVARTEYFIAASTMTAELYRSLLAVPMERLAVMPPLGFDVDLFRPAHEERSVDASSITVGFSGRLDADKGIDDLIEAVERCRAETGLDVVLRLLGAGPMKADVERVAHHKPWLEVHEAVPNSEVHRFLRELDIFVMPSRVLPDHQEHDARSLIEALAVGVPCVGTRSGIIPEILGDDTGLVVAPSSPAALAEAIGELAVNAQRRRVFSEAGRRKAEQRFSLSRIARQKRDIYLRAMR